MNDLNSLRSQRRQIAEQTAKQCSDLIKLFEEGMSLLIDASEILEAREKNINRNTVEGASKTAAWRFLSTLPTSASWSFETALSGDYIIAKNILRLTLRRNSQADLLCCLSR